VLEQASCFALIAPLGEAAALRHGFVHLRPCDSKVDEPVRGRRARSCTARVSADDEDLAFERYVATFHFLRTRPPADSAEPSKANDSFRAPTRARDALEKLTMMKAGELSEQDDVAEDGVSTVASTVTPNSSLRADAPVFVPQAVALSTAPPARWFLPVSGAQPSEAGARVPPPPTAPPAVAGLLAALHTPGPPPVPAGDPQVTCFSPQACLSPSCSVNLEDHLERFSLASHASSTTAPPSVVEEDLGSPAHTYMPVDFAR